MPSHRRPSPHCPSGAHHCTASRSPSLCSPRGALYVTAPQESFNVPLYRRLVVCRRGPWLQQSGGDHRISSLEEPFPAPPRYFVSPAGSLHHATLEEPFTTPAGSFWNPSLCCPWAVLHYASPRSTSPRCPGHLGALCHAAPIVFENFSTPPWRIPSP